MRVGIEDDWARWERVLQLGHIDVSTVESVVVAELVTGAENEFTGFTVDRSSTDSCIVGKHIRIKRDLHPRGRGS